MPFSSYWGRGKSKPTPPTHCLRAKHLTTRRLYWVLALAEVVAMISNGNSTEKSLTTRTQQTVPHRAVLCRPNHKRRRECCGIGANRGEEPNDIQKRSKNLSELRTKGKFESCDSVPLWRQETETTGKMDVKTLLAKEWEAGTQKSITVEETSTKKAVLVSCCRCWTVWEVNPEQRHKTLLKNFLQDCQEVHHCWCTGKLGFQWQVPVTWDSQI